MASTAICTRCPLQPADHQWPSDSIRLFVLCLSPLERKLPWGRVCIHCIIHYSILALESTWQIVGTWLVFVEWTDGSPWNGRGMWSRTNVHCVHFGKIPVVCFSFLLVCGSPFICSLHHLLWESLQSTEWVWGYLGLCCNSGTGQKSSRPSTCDSCCRCRQTVLSSPSLPCLSLATLFRVCIGTFKLVQLDITSLKKKWREKGPGRVTGSEPRIIFHLDSDFLSEKKRTVLIFTQKTKRSCAYYDKALGNSHTPNKS